MDYQVRLPRRTYKLNINHFVCLMIFVIAVQGTYLGFFVGILTTLERRFGISSERAGTLLALYDVGHTIAILLVGYFGSKSHLPRITGVGVILSALSMFLLALPVFIFGTVSHEADIFLKHKEIYMDNSKCDPDREITAQGEDCRREHQEHAGAFACLAVGQFLAGVFAAPFNTLAYVYIDTNVQEKRESPFLLGLLTSMYAFGPALGFALAAGLTRVYTTLGSPPPHVTINDDHWVGAWWLGFIICGILYLFAAVPLFFFPKTYKHQQAHEHHPLNKPHLPAAHFEDPAHPSKFEQFKQACKEFPYIILDLLKNPVFVTMVIAWMFGSYLIGGYQTYLPKYIETQYGRSASAADLYAGFISIGAIAVSTALGGWILTKWEIGPRKAILCLLGCWVIIVITYIIGIFLGCEQPEVEGLEYKHHLESWTFTDPFEKSCSHGCQCESVFQFDAVNFDGQNFFSPCHAGCSQYDPINDIWSSCSCAMYNSVSKGLLHPPCNIVFAYMAVMFVGLFAGNLFFMVTMMIVLRSVYDDQKAIALSFASCITNMLGFIPAPIIYGWIVDKSCILWNSRCPSDKGNCVVYNNAAFRFDFHLSNAILQLLGVAFVGFCYFLSKRQTFPEEEDDDYINEQEMQPMQRR